MSTGRINAASAIVRKAQKTNAQNRSMRRADVIGLQPLQIQIHSFGIPLSEDNDFHLSQWMRWYESKVGVKLGDTVLVHQEGSDWTVVDVISDAGVGALG